MGIDATARLLVYIPSYRRPAELGAQLERLLPQLGQHAGRVRVLVSDNATPGPEYGGIRARFEPAGIQFRRNGVNLGGNANIAMGFAFAEPDEFLWILSDDDPVSPDALDYLLPRLSPEVDLCVMRPDVTCEEDVAYAWASGWDEPLKTGTGLVSAALFHMGALAPYVPQAFSFHNTSFPHLAVVLAKAKAEGSVRFRLLRRAFEYNPAGRGDYSLSLTGFPQLAILMPRDAGERFCLEWIQHYRQAFVANAARHPLNFLATVALMKGYGGRLRELAEEAERAFARGEAACASAAELASAVADGLRAGAAGEVAALLEAHEARLGRDPDFRAAKAAWLRVAGREAEAVSLAEQVVVGHPTHPGAQGVLAAAAWERGRRKQALHHLAAALRHQPLAKESVAQAAAILPELGLADDARAVCAAYLEQHPGDRDANGWLEALDGPGAARPRSERTP